MALDTAGCILQFQLRPTRRCSLPFHDLLRFHGTGRPSPTQELTTTVMIAVVEAGEAVEGEDAAVRTTSLKSPLTRGGRDDLGMIIMGQDRRVPLDAGNKR